MDFALPVIYSVEERDGSIVSIENKIPGKSLSKILPNLSRDDKQKALTNYIASVEALREITYPDLPYGEILTKEPITSSTWKGFLSAQVNKAVSEYDLRSKVPNLEKVVDDTHALISTLADPPKSLVHGDFFPENIMLDDKLNVTGIIDFSPMTVIGDPLMDIAGGILFMEFIDGYMPVDSEILHDIVLKKYGEGIGETIRLYRLYYSFYFSGAIDDLKMYRWCINALLNAGEGSRSKVL